ncbi:kinesin-related protein 7-like [Leptopilina boulardi]|uniref:kinesin-related protein 7-like n=1 Tax=Leptopilina boulardi TaxID=63433 RepID=UPI0021F67416|nr:kinesin-related protein 7-like [Leptopilina boulardi]
MILKEKRDPTKRKTPKLDENLERITLQKILLENEADSYADFLKNINIDTAINEPAAATIPAAEILQTIWKKRRYADGKKTATKKGRCIKCTDLKKQVEELKQQLERINLEKARLEAENTFLKEEREARNAQILAEREAQQNILLAGFNQLKETVEAQNVVVRNETANTRADNNLSSVRKIAAGYWPKDVNKVIAARKPPGVKEEDFLQINTEDYFNIDQEGEEEEVDEVNEVNDEDDDDNSDNNGNDDENYDDVSEDF